jgi:hypothetical protein
MERAFVARLPEFHVGIEPWPMSFLPWPGG